MHAVKQCVIGQPTMKIPIIYWVPQQVLIHSQPLYVNSKKWLGKKPNVKSLEKEGRLPDAVIAAVGGGSNAIGMFTDFIDEKGVRLIGVEPAGHGIEVVNMVRH